MDKIKVLVKAGASDEAIVEWLGVSKQEVQEKRKEVGDIHFRERWIQHIREQRLNSTTVTVEERKERNERIRKIAREGVSIEALSSRFRLSGKQIRNILK